MDWITQIIQIDLVTSEKISSGSDNNIWYSLNATEN